VSGIPLSVATISSGSQYDASGAITPPGSSGSLTWIGMVGGTVTPLATDLTVYNGPLAKEVSAAGGSPAFINATLTALGVPDSFAGLAVCGYSGGAPAGSSATDFITYLFHNETLPARERLVLWDTGTGDSGLTSRFTFTAADGNTPVSTANWTFQSFAPFDIPTGAQIVESQGTVDVTTGNPRVTDPDAVVVVTTDVPITTLTVRAVTGYADTWGVALQNAAAQNNPPCFLAGTAILTPSGPVAVERLGPGDPVLARFAGVEPIAWIGRRRLVPRRHASPDSVWPFRILRHAVAPGVPARDLLLSPDHAVFLGGVLIPVKYLANGLTVFQDRSFETVEYWHIELARHDVLLAEALPVETYLDTGNRGAFENAGPALALHPEFGSKRWERDACAPLWGEGGPVDHVRALLLARARMLHLDPGRAAALAGRREA
jgi:collagen type I/II/III/V/XI/XXIV/XXVII alpha